MARPIAVLRSDHDRALHRLYRLAAGGAGAARIAACRSGYRRMMVACGAIGAVGVGGGPGLTLEEVGRVGLRRYPAVNADGSALVMAEDSVVGAYRNIHHRKIATLDSARRRAASERARWRQAAPGSIRWPVTRTRSVR